MITKLQPRLGNALLIALTALCARAALFAAYGPAVEVDSHEYLALGQQLLHGNLQWYTGRRTPVYPLFTAILGGIPWLIYMVQAGIGVAAAALAGDIGFRLTASRKAGLLCGLAYALGLPILLAEAAVLTEPLAAAGLILLLWLYMVWSDVAGPGTYRVTAAVGMGLTAAMLTLLRPQFAFVPLVVIIATGTILLRHRQPLWHMVLITILAGVPVMGWAGFNGATTGVYAIATGGGFNMTNHVITVVQDAPEEFAPLRDILVAERTRRTAEAGTPLMTISRAMPRLRATSGLDDAQLSRRLGRMSAAVMMRHPLAYAASAATSWAWFWSVRSMLLHSGTDSPAVYGTLRALVTPERYLLVMVNAAFLLLLAAMAFKRVRRKIPVAPGWWFAATLILGSSVFQALAERGENARYGLPTQMLVVIVEVTALWSYTEARRSAARQPLSHHSQSPSGPAA